MSLCSERLFNDVTRINFRFRLLVMWSSLHGHVSSSHHIWYTYLRPIQRYWHFPKCKMVAAAIFFKLWIWHIPAWWFSGSLAVYQIWFKYFLQSLSSKPFSSRRSFDDVTPINFTFRFLVPLVSFHIAVMHRSTKLVQIPLLPAEILALYEIQDGRRPSSWICLVEPWDHPRSPICSACPL